MNRVMCTRPLDKIYNPKNELWKKADTNFYITLGLKYAIIKTVWWCADIFWLDTPPRAVTCCYELINDIGDTIIYPKICFQLIDLLREEKIDIILGEKPSDLVHCKFLIQEARRMGIQIKIKDNLTKTINHE